MCIYFHVLDHTEPTFDDVDAFCKGRWDSCQTCHFHNDRRERMERAVNAVGLGCPIRCCVVDTGHENGLEVHVLTDTGLVLVYNQDSRRLVTVLVARVGQIRRYYEPFGEEPPSALLKRAYHNTKVCHLNV